jgi:type II secretory pathway pseudopilin PulG
LVELLIVIAIIGILAAILIPYTLHARVVAADRAAQAYDSNVATALISAIGSSGQLKPSDFSNSNLGFQAGQCYPASAGPSAQIAQLTFRKVAGKPATPSFTLHYGWGPQPSSVSSCVISGTDATGDISVSVTTTTGRSYVNGFHR